MTVFPGTLQLLRWFDVPLLLSVDLSSAASRRSQVLMAKIQRQQTVSEDPHGEAVLLALS